MLRALLLLPFLATPQDPATPAGEPLTLEYLAHASFRVHSPDGERVLLDPFADRVWLGYAFPPGIEADAICITHPHYDHDAGRLLGRSFPWKDTPVYDEPGDRRVGDVRLTGVEGKHADPWGKEFGQKNTPWIVETAGLRLAHLGDNGPLSEATTQALGRVDVLLIPVDDTEHILSNAEVEAILEALTPRVVVPMHYRHAELEPADGPEDLGGIEGWLAEREERVVRIDGHVRAFARDDLPAEREVWVFETSPDIERP